MNDNNDLEEFNTRVRSANPPSRDRKLGETAARLVSYREEEPDSPIEETHLAANKDQMWAVFGDQRYSACEKAVDVLPAGQYVIDITQDLGIHFRSADVNLDDLVELPDSVSEQIITEIETFWEREHKFREYGFLWKRGVLMWGPPGGGKTSTLQVISQRIKDRGGISLYVTSPSLAAKGLAILRHVEPSRPLIVMIEDIDAVIDNHGEADLLSLMDGELQIDNVVFIATTNYPERLDKRFINRPSRFDVVKKIGMPTAAARRVYLGHKNERLKNNASEMKKWVDATEGFSVAHIKELIISVEVFEVPMEDAVKRLKVMMHGSPSSGQSDKEFGFS